MYSKVIPSYIPPEERRKNKNNDKILSKQDYNDFIGKLSKK